MTLKIPVWKELIADRLNSKIFQQAAPGLSPEHRALVWGRVWPRQRQHHLAGPRSVSRQTSS